MKVRQDLSARDVEQLVSNLQRRLGDTSVPTLPQVAMRILELVSNPKSTIQQFTEVIKTDQALTGRLLRLANSAQYAQRTPVTKLERAMVLLGMDRLKAMALGFHLSKAAAADKNAANVKRLWTQSLFRGLLALRVAERINRDVSGEAFIVGLMSDAGVSMMPKLIGDDYLKHVNPADPPGRQFLAEFRNLELTHVDVAATLSRMWKLPELLAKPIANHHTAPAPVNPREPMSVLNAVGYYVGFIALGENDQTAPGEPPSSVAKRLFDFEPEDIEALNTQAADDFRATREFFGHLVDETLSIDTILNRANSFLETADHDLVPEPVHSSTPSSADDGSRIEAAGLVFEFEKSTGGHVTAFIADASGNRLLSEVINPKTDSDEQLRATLMLDLASRDEVARVIGAARKLAA